MMTACRSDLRLMMMMMMMVMVMMMALTACGEPSSGPSPVITTRDGVLRGTRTSLGQSHVDVFYNIPYAKPPVGDLRFQNPVANEPWTGTRDASSPGPLCPQFPYRPGTKEAYLGQEDCLYLNVYSPKIPNQPGPHSVMVFIHGGGYTVGSAVWYNGTQLAAKGVVVVTVNYRLGALGFLSTEDNVSIGNYGLRDVIRALEWVRDVISSFNGDPRDVTIFGESSGSATVSLLSQCEMARGLFNKAIMQSGSSLSSWAMRYPNSHPSPLEDAQSLAAILKCDVRGDSRRLIGCLRGKKAKDIVGATFKMFSYRVPFQPVLETTFGERGLFSATPLVSLRSGNLANVSILRGFNKDEWAAKLNIDPEQDGLSLREFQNFTRLILQFGLVSRYPGIDFDKVMSQVTKTYVTATHMSRPLCLRRAFVKIISDFDIVAPTLKETAKYDEAGRRPQYLYRFSYRSAHRLTHRWQGVIHADELSYVFGYPVANTTFLKGFVSSWTQDDVLASERLMTLWSNFAKHGNPTPPGSGLPQWLPWTQDTPRYLDLGLKVMMVDAPSTSAMRLWNDVIPGLAPPQRGGGVTA